MYIERFSIRQFAGLRNINLDFGPGLNVIVGANETGKSTVVNALYAVLFTGTNLKKSRGEDKEFLTQYMPQPVGDFIDGTVKFHNRGQEYILHKRWGNKSSITLEKPNQTISIESDIEEELKSIFELGARTYQSIVFAPQSQLKEMLDRLRDQEAIQSVSALLRAAVMNLDGVSIDRLGMDIDSELDALLKRWDYANCRPQDNKTYKTGLGIVLSSYYRQEILHQEMKRSFDIEQELHNVSVQMHACEDRAQAINLALAQLEPLEEGIMQRAALEPRIETLKKQSLELKTIFRQWPECESEFNSQQSTLEQLNRQIKQIAKEEQTYRSQKELETLDKTVKTVGEKRDLLLQLNQACQKLASISEEDINKLADQQHKITTAATSMQAGQMMASIKQKTDLDLWVTRDLDSETRFEGGEIKANGYLKLRLGDLAEIEVKSGEFDYEQIKSGWTSTQREYDRCLASLRVKDLEEAQQIKKNRDAIQADISSTRQFIDNLLGGQAYEDLKNRRQELGSLETTRPLAVIEQDREDLRKLIIKVEANLIALNNTIQVWQKDHHSREELLTAIIGREVEVKGIEAEMGRLQRLPEGFSSTEEFRLYVRSLRDELKQVGEELRKHWHEYDVKERDLPEESCEELKLQYEFASRELAKNLARAQTFMRLKQAYVETLAAMDANSYQPLTEAFSRYLSQTTRGKYRLGWLDEHFNLAMIRQDEFRMPVNLLSSGTYDSVALALRFALLEQMFPGGGGFVVLDDCLVDLDAGRREEAINIIKEYARQNQVIFTTCSRETARLLGGNTIELDQSADNS